MNGDPYLFYALVVLFGIGCLIVGWQARRLTEERRMSELYRRVRDDIERDQAGA